MKHLFRRLPIFLTICSVFVQPACGKKVDLSSIDSVNNRSNSGDNTGDPGNVPISPPSNLSCALDQRIHWRFSQPSAGSLSPVDFLFVLDTSCSTDDKRAKLATSLGGFVDSLDAQLDYRIGVMLAHGGSSSYSGKLYSSCNLPLVLNPKIHSKSDIKSTLKSDFTDVERDKGPSQDAALMYSLNRSLSGSYLTAIVNQGFYRDNAALSVIFVTDRNDICFLPNQHGYTQFPDYIASRDKVDRIAFQKYCVGSDGRTPNLTADSLYIKLQEVKGKNALYLNGIVHTQAQGVANNGTESIGHGIIELAQFDLNHYLLDITESHSSPELAQLAQTSIDKAKLMTEFQLTGNTAIDPTTVATAVDGIYVKGVFRVGTRILNLRLEDAGHFGSVIDVTACKL